MSTKPTALLLDVLSIQKYIFQSNKLKENLGASYIIEHVLFSDEILGLDKTKKWWDGKLPISNNGVIGYVGGGNALLFFNNEDDAKDYVNKISTKVMTYLPGLPLIYGMKPDFDITDKSYKSDFNALIASLVDNRNTARFGLPLLKTPYHAACVYTGQIAVAKEKGERISVAAKNRAKYMEDAKSEHLKLLGVNKGPYTFSDELDKLGQPEEKSYIAVVHIDGNGIGNKFRECPNLSKTQELSLAVNDLCKTTFKELLEVIIEELDQYELNIKEENRKKILPIRPILIGGDDITFVCEGTLGVHLAKKFIEIFQQKVVVDEKYTACAGIAIAKTKYPFNKVYELAEELCQEAKLTAKEQNPYQSALDFHIATNGIQGSWSDIKEQYYTNAEGNCLHKGPYLLKDFEKIEAGMIHFSDKKKIAKSQVQKIKETLINGMQIDREILGLQLSKINQETLVKEQQINGKNFPSIKLDYYDMIELMDFYPVSVLINNQQNSIDVLNTDKEVEK